MNIDSPYALANVQEMGVARVRKTDLLVIAPRCRSCGRALKLEEGAVAASSYGQCCSSARRDAAQRAFGLRPISAADFDGPYLLPRDRRLA
jgi:hypothetical protein